MEKDKKVFKKRVIETYFTGTEKETEDDVIQSSSPGMNLEEEFPGLSGVSEDVFDAEMIP